MSKPTPSEVAAVRASIAERCNRIWPALEKAGIDPMDILNFSALGMIWGIGSKAAGVTRDAFLMAAADIYDSSEVYEAEIEEKAQEKGGEGA